MQLGRVTRGIVVALVAGLPAGTALAVASAGRTTPRATSPATVRIVSASQRVLLRDRSVLVRVSVPSARWVRLAVIGSPVRSVRFARPGTRLVRLPLGAAARRALSSCARRSLAVRAASSGRRTAVGRRVVVVDLPACRPAAGGGAAGQPSGGAGGAQAGGSGSGSGGGESGGGGPGKGTPGPARSATVAGGDDRKCDFLDPSVCLQPWPNDWFTRADASAATGRRLNLDPLAMPRNRFGKPVDATEQNRLDGFSPGNPIITRVPGLDSQEALARTGAVPITDMARYADPDQPVVVIDAATGERHPVWTEVDANPATPADRNLIVRPAVNFLEGHRYVVALRHLRRADGSAIDASDAFRVYRDRWTTAQPVVEERRAHMEALFATLGAAGIARDDLYLAWDFTVGSASSIAGRMLSIRDRAFAKLGDTNLADLQVQGTSPAFAVDQVIDNPDSDDPRIARRVRGTVTVPCYLNAPGCPSGSTFQLGPDGLPLEIPGNVVQAQFRCDIARTVLDGGPPARPSLYGHGLLGSREEAGQDQLKALANDHRFVFCATDWIGMACADVPTSPEDVQAIVENLPGRRDAPNCDLPAIVTILNDVSNFPKLADRVQQGMLNFLYLGRAMIHPAGLAANAAFKRADGTSVLDTTRLFYDGNSQGGIIGGALAAVGVDHERAALGVPGMNYSTLLRRSVDFDNYAFGKFDSSLPDTPLGLYDNYPNELERPLLLALMQLLWDRAEANGYAQHMTSQPYPNTPAHKVMLHLGFGDHQVANVAAEVEARTVGARTIEPYLDPGRSPYSTTTPWGIPAIGAFPFDGSAIVMWDSGSPTPPITETPPRAGKDPHEFPRRTPEARAMKSAFLRVDGQVVNTCGPHACYANGYRPAP